MFPVFAMAKTKESQTAKSKTKAFAKPKPDPKPKKSIDKKKASLGGGSNPKTPAVKTKHGKSSPQDVPAAPPSISSQNGGKGPGTIASFFVPKSEGEPTSTMSTALSSKAPTP